MLYPQVRTLPFQSVENMHGFDNTSDEHCKDVNANKIISLLIFMEYICTYYYNLNLLR